MLDNAVKILRQRQQTVNAQLKRLQAEAGQLAQARHALETLADVVTAAAPVAQPAKKRTLSAAGHQALAAAVRERWAQGRTQKAAEAQAHLLPERDHHRANFGAEQAEQKSEALVPASQMIPCTCGGINTTCMYCAGTGMREPS